jgi:hypothetical protein
MLSIKSLIPAALSGWNSGGTRMQFTRMLIFVTLTPILVADARYDQYFATSVKWSRDVLQNWNVEFVPMDTSKYGYEIQVAGQGSLKLRDQDNFPSCTKFAASYRRSLAVKNVSGEIGISSPKAFEAKISGNATSVEVFGGGYNRFGSPVVSEVHLRVAVYQNGQLAYTTPWYGAPSGDILHWKWQAACQWVTVQK